MNHEKTFALVANMTSIHTLIAVSLVSQWHIFQMDAKNIFSNGDVHKEVYMAPLLDVSHNQREMCKLKKALYGLKQSSWVWFKRFSIIITSIGFHFSGHDSTLFVRNTSHGRMLL